MTARAVAMREHMILGLAEVRISKEDPELEPLTGETYTSPQRWRRRLAWAAVAAAGITAGIGLGFTIRARSDQDAARRADSSSSLTELNDSAESAALAALGLYAGAAALGGTAVYLLVTSPEPDLGPRETTVGLGVSWRFR